MKGEGADKAEKLVKIQHQFAIHDLDVLALGLKPRYHFHDQVAVGFHEHV